MFSLLLLWNNYAAPRLHLLVNFPFYSFVQYTHILSYYLYINSIGMYIYIFKDAFVHYSVMYLYSSRQLHKMHALVGK